MPRSNRKTRCLKGVKNDDGNIVGQCIRVAAHPLEHIVITGWGSFSWSDGDPNEFEYDPHEEE